jgi:hypothetical protein
MMAIDCNRVPSTLGLGIVRSVTRFATQSVYGEEKSLKFIKNGAKYRNAIEAQGPIVSGA